MSENGKITPAVGAIVVKDGEAIASAYWSEMNAGDHAEYTALELKLAGCDISGATVYTTLEPCSKRGPKKVPCGNRLVQRGISEVIVGMLDPDPRIYAMGCGLLRAQGMTVRYFPEYLRTIVNEINRGFIDKFRANPACSGTARFDYTNSGGIFTIGHGEYLFDTKWSGASGVSIYLYNDPKSIHSIAEARGADNFSDVVDAGVYDFSSRARSIDEGKIAVLKNENGYYAVIKVLDVLARDRPPDDRNEVVFEYRILTDRTSDFSILENPTNSDSLDL